MTKKRDLTDIIIGVVTMAVGAAVIVYAFGLPRLNTGDLGPGLLPAVVGAGLVLAGGILLAQAIAGKVVPDDGGAMALAENAASESDDTGDAGAYRIIGEGPRRLALNAVTVVGSILFYILTAEWIGFILTMFLVLCMIQFVLGARWRQAILVAIGTTAVLYMLFERLLLVQLPNGLLGI
ncbi:tripartite tricarboxylate transporter TctB family protein [Isoptericola halotolerans]|uniref:tripartite tricarboxylate transporter TctB family protein n=1 Tax=Isoptericola halotolerans TaxID=300560 RepID=UPI00388EDBF5